MKKIGLKNLKILKKNNLILIIIACIKDYCERQGNNIFECSVDEGCILKDEKCKINDSKNLPNTLFW